MDSSEQSGKKPAAEGTCLLTVVSPRRGEGNSPTGIVGRRLARQLLAVGRDVRVLAEPGQCGGWPDTADVVAGSITRPLESARAFGGAEAVFLAGAHPSTVGDALALARRGGARKVVLLSSHGPEFEEANPPETWYWLAIEKAVEHSGIPWTHIRPSAVMGAVIEGSYPATGSDWPDTVRTGGVVREAFLDQGHYPFIHEEDLAAVAAAALVGGDYCGTVVEAVGPPLSTRSRIASIARALGREIGTVDLTADEGRAVWRRLGWPDGAVDVTLYALEEYGARFAELLRWTADQRPSVHDIIGRPPLTYDDWVREHIDRFR
ncbi:SDR family oxidoreductase [Streptomyces tirandamycinicus]|uniref:NmrA family transcriptional regulator n=1 Tax=Streptomyces tirandamycinicus TaxID=2174846 RepID=A0A2S1SMC8_9ACTN|nr:NAD(P)H-binding protein [Streptomyces tirandamycinicus]AWI27563.1 NmrA family transcriptional regulator [Streptomyces tirandamycinicus]